MASNTKKNIKEILSSKIWYLLGYTIFLIASVSSYTSKKNLWALINLVIALVFLIMFTTNTGLTKNSVKRYREKLKKHFKEVIQIKDSPHSIALGFAIGTAIAVLPTFGLGVLIGLGVALIFKRISKISLFASFIVWNPFVLGALIPLEYEIGNFLLKNSIAATSNIGILNVFSNYTKKYLLGNFIIVFIASLLSYGVIYVLVNKNQKQYKKFVKSPLEQVIETVEEKVVKIDEKIQEKVQEAKEIGEKIIENK